MESRPAGAFATEGGSTRRTRGRARNLSDNDTAGFTEEPQREVRAAALVAIREHQVLPQFEGPRGEPTGGVS